MNKNQKKHRKREKTTGKIGIWKATSIGLGAMIGAGIFALLGLSVEIAGQYSYISFIIAGVIALLCSYSAAKLSVAFPRKGGPVEYINQAFGAGIRAGGLNLMSSLGYVVVTSLYARAFGEYGMALLGVEENNFLLHILINGIVLLFLAINFLGAAAVGNAGLITAGIQTIILLAFGVMGLQNADPSYIMPSQDVNLSGIILVSGIVFMSYQGFALVTNTAEDISRPKKNMPRSLYLSIAIVMIVYVLVNIAVVSNLPPEKILEAKEYVLAEAARPVFGKYGFLIMGLAALFSTSSAINSTIYGPAYRLSEMAKSGEMPKLFNKRLWAHPSGYALLVISGLVLLLANFLDLRSIAETGSMIFLVIYTTLHYANYKFYKTTKSRRWIIITGTLGSVFAFIMLFYYQIKDLRLSVFIFLGIIALSFLFEITYYKLKKEKPAEEKD